MYKRGMNKALPQLQGGRRIYRRLKEGWVRGGGWGDGGGYISDAEGGLQRPARKRREGGGWGGGIRGKTEAPSSQERGRRDGGWWRERSTHCEGSRGRGRSLASGFYRGVVWSGITGTALYTGSLFVLIPGCCWVDRSSPRNTCLLVVPTCIFMICAVLCSFAPPC